MSQRKAKRQGPFKISGIEVFDEKGKRIEHPKPVHYRYALLRLLEETGSFVQHITVDGHVCAFVMENPDEVPEAEADTYYEHLVEAMKIWTGTVASSLAQVRAEKQSNAPGGDA